jgi:hypothetical protein
VAVTSLLVSPEVVCTTTELCTTPLVCDRPMLGPAGPRNVSAKNHATCDELSLIAVTPSPPAQSAHVELLE